MGTGVMFVWAGLEWWRAYHPSPPQPLGVTVLAVGCAGYAAYQWKKYSPRIEALKQGRDGERVVGQQLETLRTKGCHVFHDIPGDNFNLDHVLVSPRGIYVVETKTLSKPTQRDARVTFDGQALLVDGVERDYLRQAAAQRSWLRNLLQETTGKQFAVRSVVVFPGWYVDCVGSWRKSGVWVMNPKRLPAFLDHEAVVLQPSDVALASSTLSRYVQTSRP
jgi:hypothetical protein